MRIADLPTPALLLDLSILDRNLARMRERSRSLGVALRPHLKTAKAAEVARRAEAGAGIAVSTLSEARFFLGQGFRDITYAVGITPQKLPEVAALMAAGARLQIITDDLEAAQAIAGIGQAQGFRVPVLIEIDTGQGRGGLAPEDERISEIGRVLQGSDGAALAGVLTHAGQSYRCGTLEAIRGVAEQERSGALRAADRLRAAGLPCPTISVGSTPTALTAAHLNGVTEMRPGVYMFMDLYQCSLGLCGEADLAVSVLASVIGRRSSQELMLVDAGALALSQDQSLPGYGRVAGLPLRVAAVNQEHGFLRADAGASLPALAVGDRLRILPNHVCMTAAMFDRYHVIEDGSVVAEWQRCRGW